MLYQTPFPKSYKKSTRNKLTINSSLERAFMTKNHIWIDKSQNNSDIIIIDFGMEFSDHDNIPVFSFAPLNQIEKDLKSLGWSDEEIVSTIRGLSELPEYADNK